MSGYRLGVDIGGTFTDIVLLAENGALRTRKILSTPHDYSEAIEAGVRALLERCEVEPGAITEVSHGTTVATNAIIERKGVSVALVTTQGFRDVLEIARFRAPRLYDVHFRKPEPLVERRLRLEVPERMSAAGEVLIPIDEAVLEQCARTCLAAGVSAVAVCFINAYVNGEHERCARAVFERVAPDLPVTISSELLPQIQEYERTSTTVINAYLRPVIERYVNRLEARLAAIGIRVPLNIMQSSGGLLRAEQAARMPMFIIESGPAAGVVGARQLLDQLGRRDLIVFDMGGTTAKASVIADGRYSMAPEAEVGGSAALGHRMVRGGGHVVQAPTIDIAEVGAGGGSIAWVDAGGAFQVGPGSAGASPGPACYGRGGDEPTVTDANLVLGFLNPDRLVGDEVRLDIVLAKTAIGALAERLGQSVTDTAYGIHLIANARMMRALSAVTSERGLNPSRFPIFAFGGNGGVHVCGLAEALGIDEVLVPPSAGVFSALGLLFADTEHACVKGFYQRLDSTGPEALDAAFRQVAAEADALLDSDGYAPAARAFAYEIELKYVGQNSALPVPVEQLPLAPEALAGIVERFGEAHRTTYGYRSDDEPLQVVAVKAIGRGIASHPRVPAAIELAPEEGGAGATREVYFGPEQGWVATPVVGRLALEAPAQGPMVIEEYDTTTVVRPGWRASLDRWNNIELRRS